MAILLLTACSIAEKSSDYLLLNSANQVSKENCYDDLDLEFELQYDLGIWRYKQLSNSEIWLCLPQNSSIEAMPITPTYTNNIFNPSQHYGIFIPSIDDENNYNSFMKYPDPHLSVRMLVITDIVGDSLEDWIIKTAGGRYENTDSCSSFNASYHDYDAPHFINIKQQIKRKNTNYAIFEACKIKGSAIAMKKQNRVFILSPHRYDIETEKTSNFMMAIFNTLKISIEEK